MLYVSQHFFSNDTTFSWVEPVLRTVSIENKVPRKEMKVPPVRLQGGTFGSQVEHFTTGPLRSSISTPGRRQLKTPILSRNVYQKSLETELFLIAICRQCGDKWQLKTLFLTIFDLRLLIVDSFFYCRLPGVISAVCVEQGWSVICK